VLAGLPGAASAAAATCGTACAGACAPPLLGLLGISGSSAVLVAWMAPFRPLFIGISVAALGIAFFRAYRRPPAAPAPRFIESRKFVWLMAFVCAALFGLPIGKRPLASAARPPCNSQPCPLPNNASSPCPP
jgi:hypothetical protein